MNLQMKVVERQSMDNFQEQSASRKKVLLVDDINFFIEIEKSALLKMENFQTLTAYSGTEALQIIQEERPDLVYLDLYMDNMDGDECCRFIKQTYGSSMPVVMLTHGSSVGDFDRCWESGCDSIIAKPINPHLLIATTKKYLKMQPNVINHGDVRHAAYVKVKYGASMQETLTDYSINLSTGGMFLATANVLPVDTGLSIEFTLPVQSTPVCCKARVAWINEPNNLTMPEMPAGMGLQFVGISLSDVDAIREYLMVAYW